MYKKILVPLDGSSRAEKILPHVKNLAKVNGSEVMILKVLDGVVGEDEPLGLVDHGGELGSEKFDMVIR